MKRQRGPSRLAEIGSGAPAELAAGIRQLRAEHGSPEQVMRLQERLGSQLALDAVTSPSALGLGAGGKWLLLGLLAGLGSGLFAIAHPTRVAAPKAPASAEVKPPPVAEPGPQHPPAIAPPAAGPRVPGLEPPAAERAPAPPRRPHAAGRVPAPAHAAEDELALLKRSQAALDRDPQAALALADRHAREYPRGVFAQEREILAIEALLKLGRQPQARARAERFLSRFPDSPHARRARALLERAPTPGNATIRAPGSDSIAEHELPGGTP